MKKKLNFQPQEVIATMVEAIVAGYLTHNGTLPEQASLIGRGLGSIIKGMSISDESAKGKILDSLNKAILELLDSRSYELTDTCKNMLQNNVLSAREIIKYMSRSDIYISLKKQIVLIFNREPECDISTFPVDEFVNEIIDKFEKEVFDNHELASYATYCMLRKTMSTKDVYVANKQYVDSFKEPLFLHKDVNGACVNLENLFVLPKYQVKEYIYCESKEKVDKNLEDVIADFLQETQVPALFIEGDAGSGKTTLIAWMNYHYSLGDEIAAYLFGKRPLLTIRLRDLDKKDIAENVSLTTAICRYMNLSSLDELEMLFPGAVMLLDGFDELCMIEGIQAQHEMLLYDLCQKKLEGFQFVVTTRPKFISRKIDIPSKHIFLEHFDSEQRKTWLEHYTSHKYCAQAMDEEVYEYIKNIDDDTASCICDTPMTLYMLAAKNGTAMFFDNNWELYHHIFYEELSETEYNKMFPNPDRKYYHDIRKLRDALYQISEEIAYQMYKEENRTFYLSDNELSAIIQKLSVKIPILKQVNMQEVAERCYALCCYWKANSERGVVEFLHNNIRDFFLAEKIYREMDELALYLKANQNMDCHAKITNKLSSLFQYGDLETKVSEFIFLRAKYNVEKNEFDFAKYEYENKWIAQIIVKMSRNGIMDSGVLSKKLLINPIQRISNIVKCTVQLYRHIYEAHLKEFERIQWFPSTAISSNILEDLFGQAFCQVPVAISTDYTFTLGSRGYFNNMDLSRRDLRYIGFKGSSIVCSKFMDTILTGSDFSNTDLSSSDFSCAVVCYVSFENAVLKYCDFTDANLRGAYLPDGFMSEEQEEQVKHLKSLQIEGLKI